MSAPSDPHAEVRRELIEAIDAGKWEFTKRALREGLVVFTRHSEHPSDTELIDYIQELLEGGFPLREVELHDPPYGQGYELVNTDGQGLYIKLNLDWPYALVLSVHDSTR
jgi:hypothetical protein